LSAFFWHDFVFHAFSYVVYKFLRCHPKDITNVAFHRSYPLFASCSDDCTAYVFHGMVYSDLNQNPLIVPLEILRGHASSNGRGEFFFDIHVAYTCTHRKLRGRWILFWIGIRLKFRHTLLVVTLSKAGWGICLSLISTWRIWLFNNRTTLANPRSDICACAAIIVSPALSWGKKSYILLVARGCFVVKSSVCCL